MDNYINEYICTEEIVREAVRLWSRNEYGYRIFITEIISLILFVVFLYRKNEFILLFSMITFSISILIKFAKRKTEETEIELLQKTYTPGRIIKVKNGNSLLGIVTEDSEKYISYSYLYNIFESEKLIVITNIDGVVAILKRDGFIETSAKKFVDDIKKKLEKK